MIILWVYILSPKARDAMTVPNRWRILYRCSMSTSEAIQQVSWSCFAQNDRHDRQRQGQWIIVYIIILNMPINMNEPLDCVSCTLTVPKTSYDTRSDHLLPFCMGEAMTFCRCDRQFHFADRRGDNLEFS